MTFDKLKSRQGIENNTAPELSRGWEIKKLGECFRLKSGENLTAKNMIENGEYPVFGGNGIAGYYNDFNLKKDNVIIGRVGALCGNVRHITENIWLTDNAFKIVDFKFDFDNSFLTYLLNFKNLRSYARQTAQPVISNSSLKEVIISFPKSKEEQQRIVSQLDRAFAAIDQAKANYERCLSLSKGLFESYLQGVFENGGEGWNEKTLQEVFDVRDGTHDSPKYQNNGYPLITSKNLKNDKLTYDKVKFISESDFININKRSKVDKGDVLFAMIGTIGNPIVIEEEPDFAIKNVALFKVEKNQNSYFLKYFLDSKQTIEKMLADAKGTTQKFVGLGYLRNFPIAIPDFEEQNKIVSKIDSLKAETQKLETLYQRKIAALDELKKSILQKAMAGELAESQGELRSGKPVEQKTEKAIGI